MNRGAPGSLAIERAGTAFHLLPERAVWWPAERALLVADLHWGKEASFRAAGSFLPTGGLAADLARLAGLITRHQPRQVWILGDLIHARTSLAPEVVETVAAWRRKQPVAIDLIEGNHDRHAPTLPDSWHIRRGLTEAIVGGVVLRHHPDPHPAGFVWSGHLHPVVRLGRGKERLRLPCFHVGARVGVLPAFAAFTGGIEPDFPGDVFALTEDAVEALGPR